MNYDYDSCRAALDKLSKWYEENKSTRNEATTRLQLIDRLFTECLGWEASDIVVEDSCEETYADYVFRAPSPILVIEAKKEGDYFDIPTGAVKIQRVIKSLARDSKSLRLALDQVSVYCHKRGVPLGAVCNGHQLVAFVATRNDGTSPMEGKAVVFVSFDHMVEEFTELWNCLSKPAIEQRDLIYKLLGSAIPELPSKLSSRIFGYPGVKNRNPFQTELQMVSELVLEDITHSRELEETFLEECYCMSGALSQYALTSKAILDARYSALFDSESPGPSITPVVTKKGITSELLANSMSRRPILLLGDVGSGKTIFIRYLIMIDAKAQFEEGIALYIDFGSQATLAANLKEFIIDEISRQLLNNYNIDIEDRNFIRGIYNLDIERFQHSIYADLKDSDPAQFMQKEISFLEEKVRNKEQHICQSLGHIIKGRLKRVVIFLDNSDQRDESTQQEVFLIAQEIAEHWPSTVFVTLRPETFHRSQKLGALSGYHPRAFTIAPPRIDRVLKKRMEFALRITSGEIPLRTEYGEIQISFSKLDSIIRVFNSSLDRNDSLVEFLDNISAGNVRLALELVREFFSSGHVNTKKIIEIYENTGDYLVPLHEFLRAVFYGDAEHYDPSRSPMANLFDVTTVDLAEHFLLPLVLGHLSVSATISGNNGFVETVRVYDRMQSIGYTPEQIDGAVIRAYRYKLLETAVRLIPTNSEHMPDAFRITTTGQYHLLRLMCLFPYIDAIVVDTPIFDDKAREKIHDVRNIEERLDRAEIFREYLDGIWQFDPETTSLFDWPATSFELLNNIKRIRARITA